MQERKYRIPDYACVPSLFPQNCARTSTINQHRRKHVRPWIDSVPQLPRRDSTVPSAKQWKTRHRKHRSGSAFQPEVSFPSSLPSVRNLSMFLFDTINLRPGSHFLVCTVSNNLSFFQHSRLVTRESYTVHRRDFSRDRFLISSVKIPLKLQFHCWPIQWF